MLNKAMLNTIKSLGLGAYIDNYGYNVIEIPYNNYKNIVANVNTFMASNPNLSLIMVNDFGEESTNVEENLTVVIFDKKVWEENELI